MENLLIFIIHLSFFEVVIRFRIYFSDFPNLRSIHFGNEVFHQSSTTVFESINEVERNE